MARQTVWLTTIACLGFAMVVAGLTLRAQSRIHQPGVTYPEADSAQWVFRDFRDAIYYPVLAFREENNPYQWQSYTTEYPVGQHFPPYSPLTLLVHWPLASASIDVAQWIYFGVNVGFTVLLALCLLRIAEFRTSLPGVLLLAAVILISRPGQMNLLLGQSTTLLALATVLCLHWGARRPWAAALCLALTTVKPTYGLWVLALLAAQRHYRAAIFGVVVTLAVTVPVATVVITQAGGVEPFVQSLKENVTAFDANPGRDPLQSFTRVDAYVLVVRMLGAPPASWIEFAFALAVMATGCWLVRIAALRGDTAATGGGFAIGISFLLISIYHHSYDLIVLWLPLLAAIAARDRFWSRMGPLPRYAWIAAVLLTMFNYVSTKTGLAVLSPSPAWRIWITSLNSIALCCAAGCLVWSLWRQRDDQSV